MTEQDAREITITRLIDAPREMVFRAFTDAEQVSKWWGPETFGVSSAESDARAGGALRIVMRGPDGIDYPMEGVYREFEPPERLVMESWALGEGGRKLLESMNTLTFADHDGKTELTLHARGVALVPEAIPMIGGMEAGWAQSLRRLDDVLTGAVDRQIVLTRVLQAPRERVFEAFVTRDQVEQWWGPDGFSITTDEMDVRPGGTWRFTMHGPDGTDYPNLVIYEEVSPPVLLEFEHSGEADSDDITFHGTVAFDEMMGMTVLTMKSVFETAEARDEIVAKHNAVEGGNQTLARLEGYLSGANV
jgi:uncharacterized protein YndB with AHSA1/START domain